MSIWVGIGAANVWSTVVPMMANGSLTNGTAMQVFLPDEYDSISSKFSVNKSAYFLLAEENFQYGESTNQFTQIETTPFNKIK